MHACPSSSPHRRCTNYYLNATCAQDLLAAEGTGYLVGGNLTYVDLALFQKLYELGQEDNLGSGVIRVVLLLAAAMCTCHAEELT